MSFRDIVTTYRNKSASVANGASNSGWKATLATAALSIPAASILVRNLGSGTITFKINATTNDAISVLAGGSFGTDGTIRSIRELYFSNSSGAAVTVEVFEVPETD